MGGRPNQAKPPPSVAGARHRLDRTILLAGVVVTPLVAVVEFIVSALTDKSFRWVNQVP